MARIVQKAKHSVHISEDKQSLSSDFLAWGVSNPKPCLSAVCMSVSMSS